ncbi:MAG: fatty acid desaturase [Arenicella sp.]
MSISSSDWYHCDIERKQLKLLMKRSNLHGLLYFSIWLCCLLTTGFIAYQFIGSWWAIPLFMLYGSLFCFAESFAHECSHGTPFRSRWLNEGVYFFVTLLLFKERTYHRWMHARHHTHTLFISEDPEIQFPRPTVLPHLFLEIFKLRNAAEFIPIIFRHALGQFTERTRACSH